MGLDGSGRRALWSGEADSYPGPADPRGELALVLTATQTPAGLSSQSLRAHVLATGEDRPLAGPWGILREPVWSPDGAWIAYESSADGFRDIYRVDREGAEVRRLTWSGDGAFEPDVSPDGQVVFVSSAEGDLDLWTVPPEGGPATRVVARPGEDGRPRWSPDGTTLAWLGVEGKNRAVWWQPDGAPPRRLRSEPSRYMAHDLVWHPDGTQIAVSVQRGPADLAIEIVSFPAGEVVARLDAEGRDEHPAWSPDGAWIAWSSEARGIADVWVARRDGTDARAVAETAETDWLVRWLPPPQP
jgi:TolB protein